MVHRVYHFPDVGNMVYSIASAFEANRGLNRLSHLGRGFA
jgi:hypothetical protein